METSARRLYKSRTERMIDGVCGGFAEYFGLDVTLVRIAWVLLSLLGGSGILLYIIAMIVMPVNKLCAAMAPPATQRSSGANSKFWGILLIGVGVVWLMGNLDIDFWHNWWWLRWDSVLPVVLILAGVAFIFGGRNYVQGSPMQPAADVVPTPPGTEVPPPFAEPPRLYKSRTDRKLFGVCGGLGKYMNTDSTLVRLLFVIAAFASFGFAILFYIVMAIVIRDEPIAAPNATQPA